MDRHTLVNTSTTALEIVRKVYPGKEKLFRQQRVTSTSASGNIPGIATGGVSASRVTEAEEISLEFLKKVLSPRDWKQSLCILNDEIQSVTEDRQACLLSLHLETYRLPIVTIRAGLADSMEKLKSFLSPRLATGNTRILGHVCLCGRNARPVPHRLYFRPTGLSRRRDSGSIGGLAVACPHRNGGPALGIGPSRLRSGRGGFGGCRPAGHGLPGRKLPGSAEHSDERILRLGGWYSASVTRTGILQSRVGDIIEAKADQKGQKSGRIAKGVDAENLLDHLIPQGVLQTDKTDMFSFPIPSLRTWLI